MEPEDTPNPFIALALSDEATGLAQGKAEATALVERVRAGEVDAYGLFQAIQAAALNGFDRYGLRGFAMVLHEELTKK